MTSNDMSLNAIVKDMVNEYVKPKYPLYRAYYIAVYMPDGCDMRKKRKNKIVECIPDKELQGIPNEIEFEDNMITDSMVEEFDRNGVIEHEGTNYDMDQLTDWELTDLDYIIYKLERLA